jgi:hypothetical protein
MNTFVKGTGLRDAKYARGGPSITTKSRFLKSPNQFTAKAANVQRSDYGSKKDPLAKPQGETKSEKPIKPRT